MVGGVYLLLNTCQMGGAHCPAPDSIYSVKLQKSSGAS